MQSYLQRWCIMMGPLEILEEAPLCWWDAILNPLLLVPCQVPLSVSDTWYYDRAALYCTSCALYWEVNRNKWGHMTSLNRKSFDDIKLVMVKVFFIVVSLVWTIFDCTHFSPCFWTMCLGKGGRNPHSNVSVRSSTSCVQPAEVLSDGEQMTAELRDIVCQFMQKVSVKMCQRRNLHTPRSICHPSPNQVEEFKQSVSHLSVSTTEQQDVSF